MATRNSSRTTEAHAPKEEARKHRSAIPAEDISRPDRRQNILRSAELLFAQRGYHAVSVRDIAADAGVPFALVGYYFGKKHELFKTIFDHRKAYIADRMKGISEVDCSGGNPQAVEDIVRAWAEPVVTLRADANGEPFSVLVARAMWEPGEEVVEIAKEYYDPLAAVFIEAMCEALPGVTRDSVVWGYEFALGALLMFVADQRVERLSKHGAKSGDPAQSELLIRFVVEGFISIGARSR
jgi:AcrR family transcriptional regulator